MRNLICVIITIVLLSCETNFTELNTDPNVSVPPLETLFSFALKETLTYKNQGEWHHENHQKMTWLQYLVQGEANAGDVNSILRGTKYETFYLSILNHLSEMRYQISQFDEIKRKAYQKLIAATDILQVFFALRVTDQYGDIPYSEASGGRRENKLDPIYDKQEHLFDQFINELDNAIMKLDDNITSVYDFSASDFVYHGDPNKWIKCANAIKLRIATRLLSQDETKAKGIISSVISDGRLFKNENDQFTFDIGGTYRGSVDPPFEWKGLMWAAKPMVDFMKKTVDPRLRIFYEPNGYTQETIDAFTDPSTISPAVDIENDNAILYTMPDGESIRGYRFIGAPTYRQDPNTNINGYYLYIDDPNTIGQNTVMVSKFNRRLIQECNYDYGGLPPATGNHVDVMLSYAEVCFMLSEFILKGYITGNAKTWYNKGIQSSMVTYNRIAEKADLTLRVANKIYPYLPVTQTEIDNYLSSPFILFDGINDLEKVYIQQFLNFYRLPSEGWITVMRSGFPKYGSSLLPRLPIDNNEIPFPRRIPPPEPGDLNLNNWLNANLSQDFSNPRDQNPMVLNTERLWWDKNNPAIGSGAN